MNLLIIEDDSLWQLKLQMMTHGLQFETVSLVKSLAEAQHFLNQQVPDLVLADILLPDGDTVSFLTKNHRDLPVIFLTSFTDDSYLKKALTMPFIGFLVKPFDGLTLKAAIEILLLRIPVKSPSPKSGFNVIGKYKERIHIPLTDIYWIKTEGNYSIIHTSDHKYVLKCSLRKMIDELTDRFVQVQKGYVINSDYIQSIGVDTIQINSHPIPIGRKFKKKLLDTLRG